MCGEIGLDHRPDMLTTRWCSSNHSKWLRRVALGFKAAMSRVRVSLMAGFAYNCKFARE
jgi:hypothetical protein